MDERKNFREIKTLLKSLYKIVRLIDRDILLIRNIKHGLIYWRYNSENGNWDIYYNNDIKISDIEQKDLVMDFFLGSRFDKYYSMLNLIRAKYLDNIFENINKHFCIAVKERTEQTILISYQGRHEFKITFNYNTLNFNVEYHPFEFYFNDISSTKISNIIVLLEKIINSYHNYQS